VVVLVTLVVLVVVVAVSLDVLLTRSLAIHMQVQTPLSIW